MRSRRSTVRGDDGFVMPFVLLVIAIVCLGVAGTFAVTTPNITKARDDANGQRASAAARAGVDDAEAWLEGDALCRSTTRICDKALGATGVAVLPPGAGSTTVLRSALTALGAAVTWKIDPAITADGNVRVRSTATVDKSSRTVVADLALAPSILSFGYYSDFESVSPDVLVDANPARTIRLDNGSAYSSTTSSPKTLSWNGLTAAQVAECGLHWWNEGTTAGRANSSSTGYSETGTGNGSTVTRSALCDIVFTGGNVFDGPIYTRDALYISEDASGAGPVFNQPVVTGWGFGTHNNPAPGTMPWRRNNANKPSCCQLTTSPQKPTPARFDLQLPLDIGTQGVATNACIYKGPTRVVLNGDGTATVTSPATTAAVSGSDSRCYPTDVSGGVVGFVVDYRSGVGGGTIIARNVGTRPSAGWAETAVKNDGVVTASQTGSAMWPVARGGAAKPSTSAAPDGCTASVVYAKTANAACAWSGTPSPATPASQDGWTTASAASCPATLPGSLQPTDQRLFECEYTKKLGASQLQTYSAFRTTLKNQIVAGSCASGAVTAQQACITALLTTALPADTTTSRYRVAVKAPGTAAAGSAVDGPAPAAPLASDALFTAGPTTASRQTPTITPLTFTVTRETLSGGQPLSTPAVVPQFSVTVSQTAYAVTTPGSAAAYFPNLRDVTPYGKADTGGNIPGDLYVEGTNTGKVSLLADNDAVVTGDVADATSDPTKDAVNIVAGASVRNYNPVACVSGALASSITATSSGYCPNDVTGLSGVVTVNNDGTVNSKSAVAQYVNIRSAADRRIDAAIFALQGSFGTDNNDRGTLVGNVTVNGGVYQAHRGINGVLYSSSNGSYQTRTGYILKYRYVDLRPANLPYEPTTRSLSGRVWRVVSISGGGAS